nr:unnamed protein product [Callosobruchus chinensis]
MAIWKEYFENAHVSCLHYLVNEKLHWSERIFWLITIAICAGGTYHVIAHSIEDYNRQKAVFRVDTNYLDWTTLFPSVVICEKNGQTKALEKKKSELFGAKTSYQDNQVLHALDMAFYRPPRFGERFEACRNRPQECLQGNYSIYMKFRSICTDLLTYCSYGSEKFDCCSEFLPVDTGYGTCFAFNNWAGRVKFNLTKMPTLLVEAKKPFLVLSVLSSGSVPTTKNTRYEIADSGATNFLPASLHEIYVGVQDTVTLDPEDQMSIERRQCRHHHENNLKHFSFYSQSNCEIECYIEAQKKYCGCAAHIFPRLEEHEYCNLTGMLCTNFNKDIEAYMVRDCVCLTNCENSEINKIGYIMNKISDNHKWLGKGSQIRFYIKATPSTIRNIRYDSTPLLDLIVKIGGAVGFFLGCSFLSCIQLFYYFFIRPIANHYELKEARKNVFKNRKMNENFLVAKRKLKLKNVEKDIQNNLFKKKVQIWHVRRYHE